jgi:hypothetical protein
MVLHNSKWDRKATRNYYKKHGMVPPPRKPRQPGTHNGTDATVEGNSNNEAHSRSGSEEGYDDDVVEEEIKNPDNISSLVPDMPDAAAKKSKWDRPRQKMLTSNSWRYGDESGGEEEEDERLMDEVQLEQLGFDRAQRQIEQEELALARNVKFDPREIDLNKPFQSVVATVSNKRKKKNRYTDVNDEVYSGDQDADMSEFLVADEAEASGATMATAAAAVVKPTKGNIHKLEDKTEFYKLQREIEKSKAAKEIERKFGASAKNSGQNSNSSSGGDNGKKNAMMSDEQSIDDFLSSIDGLSVSNKSNSSTTTVDANELDELLAAATSGNIISPSFSTTASQTTRKGEASGEKISLFSGSQVQKQPAQKAVQYNQAWLDNLLN